MYEITDLGTPGGVKSHATLATAINDAGQVVGRADFPGKIFYAFFWDRQNPQTMIYLHDGWPWTTSIAFSANNSGRVVGGTVPINAAPLGDAFYCADPLSKVPTMVDLDSTVQGSTSIARGINNSDRVVGHQRRQGERDRAVFWDLAAQPLKPFPGKPPGSKAAAVNGSGKIVGRADIDGAGNFHACLWKTHLVDPQPLETPPGSLQSYAWAINDNDRVVGVYGNNIEDGTNRYACVWSNKGVVAPLFPDPPPLSFAYGINNAGAVVGALVDPQDAQNPQKNYAFYCDAPSGPPQNLNDLIDPNSGWFLTAARGINNQGQIVGAGRIGGETHAFLLTP